MRTRRLWFTVLLSLPLSSYAQKDSEPSQAISAASVVSAFPTDIPEADRLMQEYMAEREKWVAAREKARRESANVKDPVERKKIRTKLEKEEQELRRSTAALAKKLSEVEKAKRDASAPKPSN